MTFLGFGYTEMMHTHVKILMEIYYWLLVFFRTFCCYCVVKRHLDSSVEMPGLGLSNEYSLHNGDIFSKLVCFQKQ